MKNKFWKFMMMMVIIMGTAFAVSSCGDDDEDDLIVGTWGAYDENIMFCEDGTAYTWKINNGKVRVGKGYYSYNKSTGMLTLSSGHEYNQFEVLSLTSSQMKLMTRDGTIHECERINAEFSRQQLEKIYEENPMH